MLLRACAHRPVLEPRQEAGKPQASPLAARHRLQVLPVVSRRLPPLGCRRRCLAAPARASRDPGYLPLPYEEGRTEQDDMDM